jgi:hypothetical protein
VQHHPEARRIIFDLVQPTRLLKKTYDRNVTIGLDDAMFSGPKWTSSPGVGHVTVFNDKLLVRPNATRVVHQTSPLEWCIRGPFRG